jgi:hypothetical protein
VLLTNKIDLIILDFVRCQGEERLVSEGIQVFLCHLEALKCGVPCLHLFHPIAPAIKADINNKMVKARLRTWATRLQHDIPRIRVLFQRLLEFFFLCCERLDDGRNRNAVRRIADNWSLPCLAKDDAAERKAECEDSYNVYLDLAKDHTK